MQILAISYLYLITSHQSPGQKTRFSCQGKPLPLPNPPTSPQNIQTLATETLQLTLSEKIGTITCIACIPSVGQKVLDGCVVGDVNGKLYICSASGRIGKVIEAHSSSINVIKWNADGASFMTCILFYPHAYAYTSASEDGGIKIWSRNGTLKTTLVESNYPIHCAVWGMGGDCVIYTYGKHILIKSLSAGTKPIQWKAHDRSVLSLDYSQNTNTLLSCGEDGKFKLWDVIGRQLYSSSSVGQSVCKVLWAPDGDSFLVSGYGTVYLCDKMGKWTHSIYEHTYGSVMDWKWNENGTQLALGMGSGMILKAQIIQKKIEYVNYEITLEEVKRLQVYEIENANTDILDFKDPVIHFSFKFGNLVVVTLTQIYIHNERHWNTPHIIEQSNTAPITQIKQTANCFMVNDTSNMIQVFNYDGKTITTLKLSSNLQTSGKSGSISESILVAKDKADGTALHMYDLSTSKCVAIWKHVCDILQIQIYPSSSRMIGNLALLIDRNQDLYIVDLDLRVSRKLISNTENAEWNDTFPMIMSVSDGNICVWYYPYAVFLDQVAARQASFMKSTIALGNGLNVCYFSGMHGAFKRADGAIVQLSGLNPYLFLIHDSFQRKQYDQCIRLCRSAKSKEIWSCLAVMAVHAEDLNTAEVSYAAIDEAAKVYTICKIRDIKNRERRMAEMAAFKGNFKEAENILMSKHCIYRAVMMWIELFRWENALELAVKYNKYVDVVVWYRQEYLRAMGQTVETKKIFMAMLDSTRVDEVEILERIRVEDQREMQLELRT